MPFTRKNTLHRIATALSEQTPKPFPGEEEPHSVFQTDLEEDLVEIFKREFTLLEGHLFLCAGREALLDNLKTLAERKGWVNIGCRTPSLLKHFQLESLPFINKGRLDMVEAGVTDCECLVARTGTIVLSAAQASGRVFPAYVPAHIVITTRAHLVFDISDAIGRIKGKYHERLPSALFFASGPSRTADIEKRLVLGVHGPKEVYVFLLDDDANL